MVGVEYFIDPPRGEHLWEVEVVGVAGDTDLTPGEASSFSSSPSSSSSSLTGSSLPARFLCNQSVIMSGMNAARPSSLIAQSSFLFDLRLVSVWGSVPKLSFRSFYGSHADAVPQDSYFKAQMLQSICLPRMHYIK